MTAKDTRARLTVRIPRDLHDRLDLLADTTERSVNDLVVDALRDYVVSNRALIGYPAIQEALDAFLEATVEERKKTPKRERSARVRHRRRWEEDDEL